MMRGISPLISVVILIGIMVLIFVLSGSWTTSLVDELLKVTEEESLKEITCLDSNVKVISSCHRFDEAKLTLENTKLDISKFKFLVKTSDDTINLETTQGLDSFGVKTFSIRDGSPDLVDNYETSLFDITNFASILIIF